MSKFLINILYVIKIAINSVVIELELKIATEEPTDGHREL